MNANVGSSGDKRSNLPKGNVVQAGSTLTVTMKSRESGGPRVYFCRMIASIPAELTGSEWKGLHALS